MSELEGEFEFNFCIEEKSKKWKREKEKVIFKYELN